MSRVLCRRGVPRGVLSRGFSADDLLVALKGNDSENVYVELDSSGWMVPAGQAAGGAARLCVSARLAPHALCAGAALCLRAGRLCLRAAADLAPHAELLLWFADDALAALDMPFLTPRNIRARRHARHYVCHACAAPFDEPNPLKLHLFLACAPFQPERFWREVAARLRSAAPGPAPPGPAPSGPALPGPARLAPAQLEALATEWGRARGGHVCVYCGKLYSRRYGLKIHLRTHTGYRPLRCRHCLRAFGDPSNLNKHERLHAARAGAGPAEGSTVGPARYACPLCGRALARRRDLERHVRTHTHAQTEGDLESHVRTHTHAQTKGDLERHVRTHTHAQTESDLERHVRTHTHAQTEGDLERHVRTHTHAQTEGDLERHVRTHTHAQTEGDLERHVRTHTHAQTEGDLERHVRTHTHAQTEGDLESHVRTHTHAQTEGDLELEGHKLTQTAEQ